MCVLQGFESLVTLQIECSAGDDEDNPTEIADVVYESQDRLSYDAITARYFANGVYLIYNQNRWLMGSHSFERRNRALLPIGYGFAQRLWRRTIKMMVDAECKM